MNSFLDRLKKLFDDDRFSKVKAFFVKYRNYLCVCGLFVIMLPILYFFTGEDAIAARLARINSKTVTGEEYVPDKEFEVNAYPEINELITKYFTAHVNADFATLESIAAPLSEMEESYIATMSQYYESYNNITCYTKHGLSRDSYIVTVCFDVKFYDIETMAPSMVNFYVQTNADGRLYINNLYSDFNMRYNEQKVNKDVYTALRKYLTQEDYLELYYDVEESYAALIKEESEIFQMVKRTIPLVRQQWEEVVFYAQNDSTEDTSVAEGTENTEGTEIIEGTEETESSEVTETTESEATEEPESEEEAPPVVKVRALGQVNIRLTASAPEDGSNIYRVSEDGEVFEKIGEVGDWIKIRVDGNVEAYIRADFIEIVTE